MAPMLFHGLSQLGLPVVCVESRQAYQALKSVNAGEKMHRRIGVKTHHAAPPTGTQLSSSI
jgi:hypothetical protein